MTTTEVQLLGHGKERNGSAHRGFMVGGSYVVSIYRGGRGSVSGVLGRLFILRSHRLDIGMAGVGTIVVGSEWMG
jgi:hypothetical protein